MDRDPLSLIVRPTDSGRLPRFVPRVPGSVAVATPLAVSGCVTGLTDLLGLQEWSLGVGWPTRVVVDRTRLQP